MTNILSASLIFLLAAQQPSPPTFRTGVHIVEVDVVVVDKAGRPVSGLQQRDFEIMEDGAPVPIATFTAVHLSTAMDDSGIPPIDPAPRRARTTCPTTAA